MLFDRRIGRGLFDLGMGGGLFARSAASPPQLLLDLDFREPLTQDAPTATSITGRTATEAWRFNMASGNATGLIASTLLTVAGTPTYQTTFPGLYNGTDCQSIKGLRPDAATNFAASSNSTFNYDGTESLAFVVLWKGNGTPTLGRRILGKRNGGVGYLLYFLSGDGRPTAWINASYTDSAKSTIDVSQGLHEIRGEYNVTDGKIYVSVDGEARVSTVLPPGSATNSAFFSVGKVDSNAAEGEILDVMVFTGSEAEGITNDWSTPLLKLGEQYTTPVLDTYTRASLACPEVGNESGFGVRVAKVRSGAFAYGYNGNFSHASKLGAQIERARTNNCLYSEELDNTGAAGWTQNNVAVVANQAEAPDGTLTADKITASVPAGNLESSMIVGLTTGGDYTASIYIKKASGGTTVAGRLIIWDVVGAAEEIAVAFTATDEWQRISVREPTSASGAQRIRVEITTAGEAVYAWGAQHEMDWLTSYIPTGSSSASRAATICGLTNTGGNTYYNSVSGEIETAFVFGNDIDADNRYLFNFDNLFDTKDRHYALVNAAGGPSTAVNNAAGSQVISNNPITTAPADWRAQENTLRLRWNSVEDLPEGDIQDAQLNGGAWDPETTASPYTPGNNATYLAIGTYRGSSTYCINGVMSRFRVWNPYRERSV